MSIRKFRPFLWFLCLFFLAGCPSKPAEHPGKKKVERPVFEHVTPANLPDLTDDESPDSLRSAVLASLGWYGRVPPDKTFAFGSGTVSCAVLRESLAHFLDLLDSGRLDRQSLAADFDVFRVRPPGAEARMLVTGYYEPVLEGSLTEDAEFKYPLYGLPDDLLIIDLERFDPERFQGQRLIGRLEKNRVVPYYTRSEIDGGKEIDRGAQKLLWLKDLVECFFLHIQGSGVVRLPDGRTLRVGYAGANGRPYTSIGKKLIEMGAVPREQMSLQAIRDYLRAHPQDRDRLMWENESYEFFRFVDKGPVGSLGRVITGGRSVASDPKFHPRGALAFLVSEKPRFDASGNVVEWTRLGRWVLNQDTGGAIKGPGRIDLFCGTGEAAEAVAGPMKQPGEMYYFIRKGLMPAQ